MKIKFNNFIPFKGFLAMNLFGVLFIRNRSKDYWDRYSNKEYVINHESIHSAQARDYYRIEWLGYIVFYLVYFWFWIKELVLPPYDKAYRDIPFEREAYDNLMNLSYLDTRKKFNWKNHVEEN